MGKETVLALLLREKGHFVSGEAVSAELGITRAAIWKSISALRAQGYEIDAVTGRGYCLKSLPDTLTEQTVRSYLGPVETVGKRIDCFDSIDSTNAYLKRIALDGAPDGTVAVAADSPAPRLCRAPPESIRRSLSSPIPQWWRPRAIRLYGACDTEI